MRWQRCASELLPPLPLMLQCAPHPPTTHTHACTRARTLTVNHYPLPLSALRERVEGVDFHPGSVVTDVELSADRVALTLANGSRHEGDLLVGADGAGSTVRQLLCPGAVSKYTRYVAWRGVLPEALAPASTQQFLGNRFTLYQVRARRPPQGSERPARGSLGSETSRELLNGMIMRRVAAWRQ